MPSLRSASPISPGSPGGHELAVALPRWRAWILAARLPTLPAAVAPVLAGTGAAAGAGPLRPSVFAATLAAALLIQIGTNFANDVSDFRKGADRAGRLGPMRVTQTGLLSEADVVRGTVVVFGLAVLLGVYLARVGGWPIVAIGVASIAAGVLYTGGPWPLGYHGLGDLAVFIFFGVLAVAGTFYLQTGTMSVAALVASVPVGLLVTNILVVNNLRDIDTDRAAGKRTLAVRIGPRATRWQYGVFAAAAYVVPVVLWRLGAAGVLAWAPYLSLPLAWRMVRTVASEQGPALNLALKGTGQLLLLYSALLGLALWSGRGVSAGW